MYSYGHFKPGGMNNTLRKMSNISSNKDAVCLCSTNKYDKNTPGTDSVSSRISTSRRISQVIHFAKGGKTQFGNFYLGQPLNINYLGKMEGMPGGSGSPPINRF
jgi:hypothetical protein